MVKRIEGFNVDFENHEGFSATLAVDAVFDVCGIRDGIRDNDIKPGDVYDVKVIEARVVASEPECTDDAIEACHGLKEGWFDDYLIEAYYEDKGEFFMPQLV